MIFSVCYAIGLYIEANRRSYEMQQFIFTLEDDDFAVKRKQFEFKKQELEDKIEKLKVIATQPNRGTTVLNEDELIFEDYIPSDKHAIVTMIGAETYMHAYWMGAAAVIQGLREVKTRVPNIIVMIRAHDVLPPIAKTTFQRLGAKLVPIPGIDKRKLNVDIPGTWSK